MATNKKTFEKYPIIQLLDNLNNPVSAAIQVDSIYEDPGTKNPLDLIYKYESETLPVTDLSVGDRADGGKVIRQYGTLSSDIEGGAPNEDIVSAKDLYIVTDTWTGDGPNDDTTNYHVDNTLHVRKYNASELLSFWFKYDYLSKQAGHPIWFGTCADVPVGIDLTDTTDSEGTSGSALHPSFNGTSEWYWGKTIDSNEQIHPLGHIYKVIDVNSTNFFEPDLYPRRGVINPSGEYIWFIIDQNANVRSDSVKLYGFSGEDSPQEIDIEPIGNLSNAYKSTGKFGIDRGFNTNNNIGNDGLDYHIFVKYSEVEA
jgi:hypothetical protein